MGKAYHVTVKRNWTKGSPQQGLTDMGTDIITLSKIPFTTKKAAENFRAQFNRKTQEEMQKKYGDGFYHGLAVVECESHDPGEALVKWKDCGKNFTGELWFELAELGEGRDEKHVLLKVTNIDDEGNFSGKERIVLLSSFRTSGAKRGFTGVVDGHMYHDWFDILHVVSYAEIVQVNEKE